MNINYPTDASGTEFDREIHNIMDESAEPQLSKKGNFVKLRPDDSNSEKLVDRFIDKLIDDASNGDDLGLSALIIDDEDDEEADIADVTDSNQDDDDEGFSIEDPVLPDPEPVAVVTRKVKGNTNLYRQTIIGAVAAGNNQGPRERADLSGHDFTGVDLSNADLRSLILKNCILDGANFSNANCEGVDFRGCSLKGANFKGANINFSLLPLGFNKMVIMDVNTIKSEVY